MKRKIVNVPITEKGKLCIFSPIMNFNSVLNKIRLDKNTVICKANEEEKKLVAQDRILDDFWHDWNFVIRSVIPIDKKDDLEGLRFIQSAPIDCCTALRLLKTGTVGLGPEYMVWLPTFQFISKVGSSRNPIYSDTAGEYLIALDDARRIKNLYKQLVGMNAKKVQPINTAILRFNFSYISALLYSAIDLMIGLEALYLADDKELGYKLAMRASFLLGDTEKRRNEIFSILIAAYGLRSKLVHGQDIKEKIRVRPGTVISPYELLIQIRDILRGSILAFMKLVETTSHRNLVNRLLDENILSKGKLLNYSKITK